MQIVRVAFAHRTLALARPMVTARGVTTAREIFLVAPRTSDGGIGVGEIAPLPEAGTETVAAAHDAVAAIAAREHFPELPAQARDIGDWLSALGLDPRALPATCFGFQSALLALLCRRHDAPLHAFFPEPRRAALSVNALIAGSGPDVILDSAGCAVEDGYRSLKIKVGTRPLQGDIELVAQLRAAFPDVRLRLDANGAWSSADACEFSRAVERFGIEYIEDPIAAISVDALGELRRASSVPIAVDAAARDFPLIIPLLQRRLVDALVLKPAVLGTYDRIVDVSGEARRHGVDVAISSVFESSLGLAYLANLAVTQGSPTLAHGLGTAPLLNDDTLTAPLRPRRGVLQIPAVRTLPALLTEDLQAELEIPFHLP
ncbi:MAG: o-succinylbenzoate synthase [bacterium]|nr:o-succinylbenzoate synthase [bacterium]